MLLKGRRIDKFAFESFPFTDEKKILNETSVYFSPNHLRDYQHLDTK
jgi:hypothetical protein